MNAEGKIAVVDHDGRFWGFPKGHVDEGEETLAAAMREIAEEIGIKELEMKKAFEPYTREKMAFGKPEEIEVKTIYMYLFDTPEENFVLTDPRHQKARWVESEKVADLLTHPKDKEFFLSIKDSLK